MRSFAGVLIVSFGLEPTLHYTTLPKHSNCRCLPLSMSIAYLSSDKPFISRRLFLSCLPTFLLFGRRRDATYTFIGHLVALPLPEGQTLNAVTDKNSKGRAGRFEYSALHVYSVYRYKGIRR